MSKPGDHNSRFGSGLSVQKLDLLENIGSTPGTILEKFSGDPRISVMVPAAHRLKIRVQIWAQFSLLGAPSALFTLLGITEDSSEVLCFPLAVSFTRWKS